MESGKRVSNTWVIYLKNWDNLPKGTLIPDNTIDSMVSVVKNGLYL